MTKKNMIQEIQNQEAQLYLRCQRAAFEYGYDDPLTTRYRSEWISVYELMQVLGIQQDFYHPANQEAIEIKASRRASQSETRAA